MSCGPHQCLTGRACKRRSSVPVTFLPSRGTHQKRGCTYVQQGDNSKGMRFGSVAWLVQTTEGEGPDHCWCMVRNTIVSWRGAACGAATHAARGSSSGGDAGEARYPQGRHGPQGRRRRRRYGRRQLRLWRLRYGRAHGRSHGRRQPEHAAWRVCTVRARARAAHNAAPSHRPPASGRVCSS